MSELAMNDAPTGTETSDDHAKRQRRRSVAIAWALCAMAVMFFAVTIVQLKGNVGTDRFKAAKEKKMKVIQPEPKVVK